MIGIYKITSPSGKIYIGQSKDIKNRFRYYKSLHCKKQIALHRSFIKYGVDKHTFEILEECKSCELNNKERYYQEFYNVLKNGLNCLLTSTNSKKKIYSDETKAKLSKSLKGRIITKEWRENLSKAGKGRIFSNETKAKLSKSNTGRFYSKETRQKIGLNKPSCRIILDINTGVFYYSVLDLARTLNINGSNLYDKLTGRKGHKNNTQYKLV